ncbi:2-hydroxychromene-2-carboxylate isomerase [Rubrivivax sp. RP6-9]|uniref:2-hydroxychromene-2-carboxylate isomerase n=1 Tax=Rubrivivax sp. RP6-9 TaxID=3415750 RepID=UPI003CC54D03
MPATIDYHFAAQSPWTYLGHARFVQLAQAAGAQVRVKPADFGAVFAASGGLPLPKRAPQRQAYRLLELRRFSSHLGLPMHVQPRFFPVAGDPANLLITAVAAADGNAAALDIAGRVFAACWAEQRDIADTATLAALLHEAGLPAERLAASQTAATAAAYAEHTAQAIDAGVFGAPTYVVDGELFWGQDRLDFLARRLGLPAPQAT